MGAIELRANASPLRLVNPIVKLVFCVAMLFTCIALDSLLVSALTVLMVTTFTMSVGGAGIQFIRMLRIPLAFMILSLLPILLGYYNEAGSGVFIPAFGGYIGITQQSAIYGLYLFCRAFGAVCCLYMLILTTPINDLIWAISKLRCPALISDLMVFVYRYIFLLGDVVRDIQVSQKSRLVDSSKKAKFRGWASMAASVLVLSFRRVSDMYAAMESRLYTGTLAIAPGKYKPASFYAVSGAMVLGVFIFIGCII